MAHLVKTEKKKSLIELLLSRQRQADKEHKTILLLQ